ncbi:hypothetical protein OGAPHI_004818 [Ogataea philodendri]|uniref:Uncharacterized protein n=1 Tax=Ogataea philodendri TaxID=1378263 RepID=A0A9P8P2Z8_9ASCO|nr:uncharacterized protein OGAPHI_004818 [Ogataea philodendri]KAH3664104.1 hypothetical protein OGAPHI_004818 [Ogataea philodendri]
MNSPQHDGEPVQPSTPPSETRAGNSSWHLKTPVSTHQTKHHLHTPYTPHPSTKKQTLGSNVGSSPVSYRSRGSQQLQTPDQTPRISRRKDVNESIVSKINGPGAIFPMAASTVGSGRKSLVGGPKLENAQLDLSKSYKIDLEEDLQYSSEEETADQPHRLTKVTKKLDFGSVEFAMPSTPAKQVTTQEQAYKMHIAPHTSDKDDGERFIRRRSFSNPFLETGDSTRAKEPVDFSRFEEEMELVNNKTGQKIVRKLTDYEKSIKPRKLDFSKAVEEVEAPTTPRNKVQIGPFAQQTHNFDIEDGEVIRKEKIVNPFKGPSFSSAKKADKGKSEASAATLQYVDHDGKVVGLGEEKTRLTGRRLNFDSD